MQTVPARPTLPRRSAPRPRQPGRAARERPARRTAEGTDAPASRRRRRRGGRMSLEARLDELERRLDRDRGRVVQAGGRRRSRARAGKLGREQAQIGPIVENHRALRPAREQLEAARHELQTRVGPGAQGAGPGDHRRERGRGGAPQRGAARPAAAQRPQRRSGRHHRDPRWHRRRGSRHLRGRPLPHVRALRRAATLEDRDAVGQRIGREGPARGHLRDQRAGRLQPAQVRGRRAPRAARAGDRVERSHPHLDRDRGGAAQGRRGRCPDRRGAGPAHRCQACFGPRWPVGQHHRLGGAHHPPAHGSGGRDPGREEPAQEQGQGHGGAAFPTPRAGAAQGPGGRGRGSALDGRQRRASREDPHLQLPAGPHHRPPHRPGRARHARRARRRAGQDHRRLITDRPGRAAGLDGVGVGPTAS